VNGDTALDFVLQTREWVEFAIALRNMLKFFSSRLEPDAVVANLREIVDEEEVDPRSPTLYAGERRLVGRIYPDRFKIYRRPPIYWPLWWLTPGHWFKPVVAGTVTRKDNETQISIVGATPIWIKVCWFLVLLGAAGFLGLVVAFQYPYNVAHHPAHAGGMMLIGLAVLHVVAGILAVLPFIGWLMTRNDISSIVNEIENRLR
jgi:hypothetical protein